jgi:Zn finger protein HypA/HybF involved in hydrogenase expression
MSSDDDWDMLTIEKAEQKENKDLSEVKIEIGENKESESEILEKVAMEIEKKVDNLEKKVDNLDKNKLLNEEEEDFFCLNCIIPYMKGCKIS